MNTMKIFYPPVPVHISSYVKSILIIENECVATPFLLPLFANGTPTLLFSSVPVQLGDRRDHLTLFGQTTLPEQLKIRDNFKLIAYFLKPYALGPLFKIAASELTDEPVSLDVFGGKLFTPEQLLNTTNTRQLLQLIDEYLYQKGMSAIAPDKRIIYAAEKIAFRPDKQVLRSVQEELHMTERTFQRHFEECVGVLPNQFRRISQFNKAFNQVNQNNLPDFSTIAYENDYSDQSHFIRAFKAFTGLTPVAYMDTRPEI